MKRFTLIACIIFIIDRNELSSSLHVFGFIETEPSKTHWFKCNDPNENDQKQQTHTNKNREEE